MDEKESLSGHPSGVTTEASGDHSSADKPVEETAEKATMSPESSDNGDLDKPESESKTNEANSEDNKLQNHVINESNDSGGSVKDKEEPMDVDSQTHDEESGEIFKK